MPVDAVVGLQYGSEGKGRLVELIAQNYNILVRTGAPNAGHKVWNVNGTLERRQYAHQVIPCGVWANPSAQVVLGAGALIDLEQLFTEIKWIEDEKLPFDVMNQLSIDPNAVIIEKSHVDVEQPMHTSIGSTAHGCGAALIEKIRRDTNNPVKMAKNEPLLKPFISDTIQYLNRSLDAGASIMLEGTQGSMLSIVTSPHYPFCTSRDTNVSNWFAEAGLSPFHARNIYGVFRPWPIRVAGNSGPTGAPEVTWDAVVQYSGNDNIKPEKTTVTKKIRRIFEFSPQDFSRAMSINMPNRLCMNFADYINVEDYGKSHLDGDTISTLSHKTMRWMLDNLGEKTVNLLTHVGTGPEFDHYVTV